MKRINFQHGLWATVAVVLLAFTMFSCDSIAKKRADKHWSVSSTHDFPNTNWAFEEEVLDFPFEVADTSRYYDVSLTLVYDTATVNLRDIPLTLMLTTPDGMQSIASSHFLLDPITNPDVKKTRNGNNAEVTVVVFPRRKFKVTGSYNLNVYRRAEKADNYGFQSLTMKVTASKEQK